MLTTPTASQVNTLHGQVPKSSFLSVNLFTLRKVPEDEPYEKSTRHSWLFSKMEVSIRTATKKYGSQVPTNQGTSSTHFESACSTKYDITATRKKLVENKQIRIRFHRWGIVVLISAFVNRITSLTLGWETPISACISQDSLFAKLSKLFIFQESIWKA